MEQITIFIMGIATGMSILGCLIISGAKRLEKRNDRDHKDTQSNKKRDTGLYPVSSQKGPGNGIQGSSDNGKSLGKMEEEAIHSRDYISRYCGSQSCCSECCFRYNSSCSLRQGPPCMWVIEDKRIHKNEDLENN